MSMAGQSNTRRRGMSRKQKRLAVIAGIGLVLALATGLVLTALNDQIVFFYSPADLAERGIEPGQAIRLGGLVEEGSWVREGEDNVFAISDGAATVTARYVGLLPDLFREGQGVVAEGALQADGVFLASNVLAKHDENYVPREVAEALQARGEWRPGEAVPLGN